MKFVFLHTILRYLHDEMTQEERQAFEADLEQNEALQNEFQIVNEIDHDLNTLVDMDDILSGDDLEKARRLAKESIGAYEEPDRSAELLADHKVYLSGSPNPKANPGKTPVSNVARFLWPGIAATLIFAALLLKSILIPPSPDKLFDRYYQPLQVTSLVTRSQNIRPQNDPLTQALNDYRMNRYESSDSLLSVTPPGQESETGIFMSGLTKMALGDYHSAAGILDRYTANEVHYGTYQTEARWYLSLCYLKLYRPDEAKALLSDLSEEKGSYRDKAGRLLRKVEHIRKKRNADPY